MATLPDKDNSGTLSVETLTAEVIAQRLGLNGQHGQYAWRVILNSPLDAERCRVLVASIVKPDHYTHQRRPQDNSLPFAPSNPAHLDTHEPPAEIVQKLFGLCGPALVAACTSQSQESYYIAWAKPAHSLYALLREASCLPEFEKLMQKDTNAGRKLYNAFLRGVLRLLRDGSWVDLIGTDEHLDLEFRYTMQGQMDAFDRAVIDVLLFAIPILLNTTKALTAIGAMPPQHVKATAATRRQLQQNVDKLTAFSLSEETRSRVWDEEGEATELGDRVAYVYEGLCAVLATLPASAGGGTEVTRVRAPAEDPLL